MVEVHRFSYDFCCASAPAQVLTTVNLVFLVLSKIGCEFLSFLHICLSFRL